MMFLLGAGAVQVYAMVSGCFCTHWSINSLYFWYFQNVFPNPDLRLKIGGIQSVLVGSKEVKRQVGLFHKTQAFCLARWQ